MANALPVFREIRRVYASNRSTDVVNIWCDSVGNLGIYKQKTAMGHPPKIFFECPSGPSSETAGPIEIIKGAKMVPTSSIFMQSLVEISRCTAA